MTEQPRKSVQQPKAPEKDEYGCVVGVEVWDANKRKCVPITRPAMVGTKSFHEQKALKDYEDWKKRR